MKGKFVCVAASLVLADQRVDVQVKLGLRQIGQINKWLRWCSSKNLDDGQDGEEHAGHGKGGQASHAAKRVLNTAGQGHDENLETAQSLIN